MLVDYADLSIMQINHPTDEYSHDCITEALNWVSYGECAFTGPGNATNWEMSDLRSDDTLSFEANNPNDETGNCSYNTWKEWYDQKIYIEEYNAELYVKKNPLPSNATTTNDDNESDDDFLIMEVTLPEISHGTTGNELPPYPESRFLLLFLSAVLVFGGQYVKEIFGRVKLPKRSFGAIMSDVDNDDDEDDDNDDDDDDDEDDNPNNYYPYNNSNSGSGGRGMMKQENSNPNDDNFYDDEDQRRPDSDDVSDHFYSNNLILADNNTNNRIAKTPSALTANLSSNEESDNDDEMFVDRTTFLTTLGATGLLNVTVMLVLGVMCFYVGRSRETGSSSTTDLLGETNKNINPVALIFYLSGIFVVDRSIYFIVFWRK